MTFAAEQQYAWLDQRDYCGETVAINGTEYSAIVYADDDIRMDRIGAGSLRFAGVYIVEILASDLASVPASGTITTASGHTLHVKRAYRVPDMDWLWRIECGQSRERLTVPSSLK